MEYKAQSKHVRVSPRKARVVANAVKKFAPSKAMEKLQFLGKGAARPIYKTLKSALANANSAAKAETGEFKIRDILIDEGVRMKRQDFSHRPGHQGIIQKKTSHITVILTD